MVISCSTVALMAVTKAETLVFQLRAMPKKTPRYASLRGVATPRYAAWRKVKKKLKTKIIYDSTLCNSV
jgi:hypothetical protein